MSDIHLPTAPDPDDDTQQPEVRLELTRAGVQQVLSLYSQEQQSSRSENGFSIRLEDVLEVIREKRKTLAIGWAVGLAAGLLLLLVSTPLYPITARVVLERHEVSSASTDGGPGAGGSAFIATQAEVMESHSVVEAAVQAIPRAAHLDEDDDAAADAFESVQASPVSGTQVIALGYLGPDAEHGVRLLEAIVARYTAVLREAEQQSHTQKLRAKEAEIDVLEAEARGVEERMAKLQLEHELHGRAEDAASAQAAILREQTAQLTEVRNQRITLENRLAGGGDQLAILDPATRVLQEQLWQAEAELARVNLTLKPRHPATEAAQREVTVLRRQLAASSMATPEALKRDIAAARGLEAQLREVYDLERQRMAEIERHRRDEQLLVAELESIRSMSEVRRRALLDQRLVTRLAESGEVGVTARIIEAPALPEGPAWPKPKVVLAGSSIFGLLGAFGVALVSVRRDPDVWVAGPPSSGDGVGRR